MPEPRIWILPPEVAERIAAGEVVERPASVVKELVENALDAGSRRITVETEAGGKALIRVTDDGCGMTPEEVRLAIQRHATSKLRSADDLFDIHTLGFRGEAMPSIAAVSEMEVLTRTPEAAEGTRLLIRGGVVQEEQAAAANVGTQITVRRLFFNVPVREKFLRSDVAESGHITDWLQRLALAHSDVSFRLVHDGKEALLSPGSQDPLNAVVSILGRGVARDLIRVEGAGEGSGFRVQGSGEGVSGSEAGSEFEVQGSGGGGPGLGQSAIRNPQSAIEVRGFIGRPTLTRANRALQHTYINGRAVRSPILYRALDDAFRSTMPHSRNPVAVLFISVPPGAVDVNVHPAKTEVRFQDEAAVHRAVLTAIQTALRSESIQPPIQKAVAYPPPSPLTPPPSLQEPPSPAYAPATEETPFAKSAFAPPSPWTPPEEGGSARRWNTWNTPRPTSPQPSAETDDPFVEPGAPSAPPASVTAPYPPNAEHPTPNADFPTPNAQSLTPTPQSAIPDLTYLGQTQDLFILATGGGRLWVIDQHVAHERVLFDRLTAGTVQEPSEALLIPVTVEVDRPRALALEENRSVLSDLGFVIEPFGVGRFVLRSVPRSLLGRNYEAAFRDMADELAELSQGGQVRLRREEVAMAAAGRSCKSAVKAGQKLSTPEIERLLKDLREARNPHTCPHGRPVFLTYEEEEIQGLFGGRGCG